MKRAGFIIALSAALLSISACTAGPDGEPETPTATPETPPATSSNSAPAPEPTPTEEPAAEIVIPDCETLVPIEDARSLYGESVVFRGPSHVAEEFLATFDKLNLIAGGAANTEACGWGLYGTDSVGWLYATPIDEEQRAAITDAVVTAGYAESETSGYPTRELYYEDGIKGNSIVSTFVGDLWILVQMGTFETSHGYIDTAIPNLIAANPSLG